MDNYSLEEYADKIYNSQSRVHFKEVLVNYQSDCYRSATVMLWSVVVCDLIYKLKHLEDVYDDKKAESILDEIRGLQAKDPKSSTWELKLISRVWKETELLSGASYVELEHLQQQRHLAAHPIITEDMLLHSPSKETVRAMMRSVLEGVLVKPPYLAKNILHEILRDLAENNEGLTSRKQIAQFVNSRYLPRLTLPVKRSIFKSLWKLVFKTEDKECNDYRGINLGFLFALWESDKEALRETIRNDTIYYGKISPNISVISYLFSFLTHNEDVFLVLKDQIELKINHAIENDDFCKTLAWFVCGNYVEYMDRMVNYVQNPPKVPLALPYIALKYTGEVAERLGFEEDFCELLIAYYCSSRSYDAADSRFDTSISHFLRLFQRADIIKLIKHCNENSQVYGRALAQRDHKKIVDYAATFEKIEYSDYPNFYSSLGAGSTL